MKKTFCNNCSVEIKSNYIEGHISLLKGDVKTEAAIKTQHFLKIEVYETDGHSHEDSDLCFDCLCSIIDKVKERKENQNPKEKIF